MTDRCPTCGQPARLSDPQRQLYFVLIRGYCKHPKMLARGITVEGLHLYLKELYLGCREVPLPDGRVKLIPNSVSRKAGPDKLTMSEYIDKCHAWADEMGIWECKDE